RRAVVAVHALPVEGDVDVDDVPLLQHRAVGDAVADHLVDRRAQRLGEAAVAERGRVGTVGDGELVPDAVELVGGDPRSHRGAHVLQGLCGETGGAADAFDRLRVVDLAAGEGLRGGLV